MLKPGLLNLLFCARLQHCGAGLIVRREPAVGPRQVVGVVDGWLLFRGILSVIPPRPLAGARMSLRLQIIT